MATSKPSVKEVKIKLTGEYGKGFKDIVANIKELNSNLSEVTRNFKTFTEGLKNNTSVATKEVSKELKEVNDEVKKTGEETKKAADGAKGLGKAFEGLGARIRTFAQYRIINMMTQSVINLSKAAIDLESNFANIQAITSASDTEMEKLRGTILRVGEASKYSVEEIAKATTMLGQAGLSADEINNVLETTTQLAAGTGSELSNTVDLMTSALAVWGLNSEEASHLSDVMVTGMNRTKATLETFRMAVQYAGATMASLNVSFDEFASVAAAASNAGLRASVVGTGLRAMTSELISPTKKMVAGLAQLGLSTEDVNIESQGLVNVLYKLKNAGLTAANAYDLFGKRAAQFVLAAQGQLDVVDELRVAFNESGATLKAYGTQMDTVAAQWTALGNTIKEMAADILDSISWMIKGALKGINKALQGIKWLFSDKQKGEFEEIRRGFDENRRSAEAFLKVVNQIKERGYSNNSNEGRSALDDVIEAANRQFGTTISFVDPMKDLGDELERIKTELQDIANINLNNLRNISRSRADELLNSRSDEEQTELSSLSKKRDMLLPKMGEFATNNALYNATTTEYTQLSRGYFERLLKSGGNYRDIEREIRYIEKEYDRKLAEIALNKAKKVYEDVGGELVSQPDEFLDAMKSLKDESSKDMIKYKEHLENLRKKASDAKGDLTKSISLTSNELESLVADAKNIAETMELASAKDSDFWQKKFEELNIINNKEKSDYMSAFVERENNAKKVILDAIDMAIKNAEAEISSGVDTNFTDQMKHSLEEAKVILNTANLSELDKRIALLGVNKDDGKGSHSTSSYRGDPILDKAKKFNEKYSAQELALQNQKYKLDKERGRRAGVQSRLSDLGLDSSLLSSQYSKLSDLEDKRTAKAQLNLLESYKKDYDDLSKKVENGQISLQEADRQSASLISKMRDLEVQTSQAKARFVDLDEQTLEDIQAQIDKTTEETEELEREADTAWVQFKGGFKKAIKDMADSYSMNSLGKLIAEDLGNGFSDAIYSIADGTKSAKEAFSDMARSILQDISKMLIRMAVMQTMMSAFYGSSGGKISETGGVTSSTTFTATAANGGFIPKIRAAAGSMVRGGVQGKDSVPAMLMPGEYVLKKSAVDALGTNFLNDLNNNAAQTLTNTAANMMQNPYESSSESEPSVVNVWVVSKEEEAKMGPNDVIATIGKDIMRGGQTRRLIQQVVAGRK